MAMGDWDGDSEQWDLDSDLWDLAIVALSQDVILSAQQECGGTVLSALLDTLILTDSNTSADGVFEALIETCTMGGIEGVDVTSFPATIVENFEISAEHTPLIGVFEVHNAICVMECFEGADEAVGDWNSDSEQWDLDSDLWDFILAALNQDITFSAQQACEGAALSTLPDTLILSDSNVPLTGVLETHNATCIMGCVEGAGITSSPSAVIEKLEVSAEHLWYVDGWRFNNEPGNTSWISNSSRSDVWTKAGGVDSVWTSDLPL